MLGDYGVPPPPERGVVDKSRIRQWNMRWLSVARTSKVFRISVPSGWQEYEVRWVVMWRLKIFWFMRLRATGSM